MANRNRTAGLNFERQIVLEVKELGFSAVTSRAESRNMDNKGVDIFSPIGEDNQLPVHIQCKNTTINPKYDVLLSSELLPKDKPTVVFHKKTKKAKSKFMSSGDYVILKKEDFYNLLKQIKK